MGVGALTRQNGKGIGKATRPLDSRHGNELVGQLGLADRDLGDSPRGIGTSPVRGSKVGERRVGGVDGDLRSGSPGAGNHDDRASLLTNRLSRSSFEQCWLPRLKQSSYMPTMTQRMPAARAPSTAEETQR